MNKLLRSTATCVLGCLAAAWALSGMNVVLAQNLRTSDRRASAVHRPREPFHAGLLVQSMPHRFHSIAQFSSPNNAEHFITPADVASIYGFSTLFREGYTGAGQQIAVVGQSSVDLADVSRFRQAADLPEHKPTLLLVPGSGHDVRKPGDELESDIDLEYAGAMAPDADVTLVYTGSNPNYNVFDALIYAIEQNVAPIISISYGVCEAKLAEQDVALLEKILAQANAQGQTILAAAGDLGATACETPEAQAAGSAREGLAVWYPASSAYVTAVGGTMLADVGTASSWGGTTAAGQSATGYIPEVAWNESRAAVQPTLRGGGGGASMLFLKPTWQAGLGVPHDAARDVPDLALDAGIMHDGYLLCSRDSSVAVDGSCSKGFLDDSGIGLTIGGGTSFGAPIAAGMVAILDQKFGLSRIGNLSALLYPTVNQVPDAVHDVIQGDNRQPCSPGSKDCPSSGLEGYTAGRGYDQATGLGTPDVGKLFFAMTDFVDGLYSTTLSLHPAGTAYAGTAFRITAAASDLYHLDLSGTVQFFADGSALSSAVPLQNNAAECTLSFTAPGVHRISAVFTNAVTGSQTKVVLTLNIQAAPSSGPAFTLSSSSSISLPAGITAYSVAVIPSSIYSGQIAFSAAAADPSLIRYGCYFIQEAAVRAGIPAYSTLYLAGSSSGCTALSSQHGTVQKFKLQSGSARNSPGMGSRSAQKSHSKTQLALNLAAACGILFLKSVKQRARYGATAMIACFACAAFLTGCGIASTPATTGQGSYGVTLEGIDASEPTLASSTSLTFQVPS